MDTTVAIKQHKFSNGMISKNLRGDTSHPKYPSSLKTCRSWIPIPQGALVKRPGFKFIAPVKDASYAPRLIKFVFSDTLSFVLEVGNLYVRFYRNGKYVGVDLGLHTYGDSYAGGYYELVTPFTTAMLPFLKFSQVGDVITFAYGGQAAGVAGIAPRDVVHTANANGPWSIAATPLKIPAGAVTWNSPTLADGVGVVNAANTYNKGDRTYNISAVFTNTEWTAIQDAVTGAGQMPPNPPTLNPNAEVAGTLYWVPSIDRSHPAVKENWVITAVVQDSVGVVYESDPCPKLLINTSLSLDRQRPISVFAPTFGGGYTLLFYRVYRSTAGGNFGWVMDLKSTDLITTYPGSGGNPSFLDDGRSPDYTKQPPAGTDPFLVSGADSFPSVIGYLDQRRLWAASVALPSTLFLSKIGDLYNYDGTLRALTPGADTDAMRVTLASEELEQVRSFRPMRRGLLFTSQGEWAISGQGGGPVSRTSIDAKRQSAWGSSWLSPHVIGTGVVFNTAKSNMVRDFYPLYGLYSDIWDGQDLSFMARDLFDLHTLVDWDFQSVPYPVVWASRDDGVLLSMTYQHAPPSFGQQLTEGIVAWAFHDTGVGSDKFEAVCVVPEPPEDAVYCGTKRLVNGGFVRYIERMNNPIVQASPYFSGVSDVRYAGFSDAYITYDGHNDQIGYTGVNAVIDSVTNPGSANPVDYAIGSQVKVTIAGGPFVAADAAAPYGSAFVFDPENLLNLNVLAPGGPGAVSGHMIAFTNSTQVFIELDDAMTQAQVTAWRAGQNRWAIAKGQVTAAHLLNYAQESGDPNGTRGVICLADGDVQALAVWAGGVASLITPAVVICLGISYNADAELLDLFLASAEIRNKFKNVTRLGFEVSDTRDLWGGPNLTDLCQLDERTVLDAYSIMGLHTGYFELFVKGSADKTGAASVRHFQPLPATISSVTREVNLGGS